MSDAKRIVPVSVIVVNWKTEELTCNALAALFASSVQPAQVILVDNHSEDNTPAAVREQFPSVEIIENSENTGFAKANNKAIRELVNQPYVWLLNSDTETGERSLEELYQYMEEHKKIGALGPQLVYPNGTLQSVGGYFPTVANVFRYLIPFQFIFPVAIKRTLQNIGLHPQPIPDEGLDLDYVTGAAMLLRKEALDEVGLLGEQYFMYFEEADLCVRLKRGGWANRVINCEPVMHVYGGSFKTAFDKRRLSIFLDSLILFAKTHYTGVKKALIIGQVHVLKPLSLLLKRLKSFV